MLKCHTCMNKNTLLICVSNPPFNRTGPKAHGVPLSKKIVDFACPIVCNVQGKGRKLTRTRISQSKLGQDCYLIKIIIEMLFY